MKGPFDAGILALPFFEPQHTVLAERIAAWCAEHSGLWAEAADPDHTGLAVLKALGRDGWLAPADFRSLCLLREALAYSDDLADYALSIQALATYPIRAHGSPDQQGRYLPGLSRGDLVAAFALSEEQAGSDVAAIALRAERTPDGYILNGHKAWVANGTIADLYCVVARTGEGPGALGLTAFLIPATTPGLHVRDRVDVIAPRSLAHLAFEDCHIAHDAVLGRPGGGFPIAMDVLDRFRMTVGAAALGFARRAADAALARARDRRIYNGRLLDLPTVKATLADIEVKLNAAALLVTRAAWELDTGRRFTQHSSIAKLYATESAQEIIDAAVQLSGAAGLVAGSVPERLYRQIRSLRVYEGTSEIQRQIIAGHLDLRRAR